MKDGRSGPYVTDGTTNASLRKGDTVEAIDMDRASELLAERRAAGPSTRKKKAAKKKAPAKKKTAAKKTDRQEEGRGYGCVQEGARPRRAAGKEGGARRPGDEGGPERTVLRWPPGFASSRSRASTDAARPRQARALAGALGARLTHEPGATPVGTLLQALLLSPDVPAP